MKNSRIKQKITENPNGTIDIDLTCKICGKPIVQSTKYGMYCEDKCGENKDKEAYSKIMNILGKLPGIQKK